MAGAVLAGQHELGQTGKDVMLVGMAVLLGVAAVMPLQCGSWKATYGEKSFQRCTNSSQSISK